MRNIFNVSDVWQTFGIDFIKFKRTRWNQPVHNPVVFLFESFGIERGIWLIIPQLIIENQAIDKEERVYFIQSILSWICLSVIYNWLFWHRRHHQSSWICISREGFVTNFGAMVIGGTQFLALTLGIGKTFGFFIFRCAYIPWIHVGDWRVTDWLMFLRFG